MDNLIESIEKLVYQIIVLSVLIPKTIFRMLVDVKFIGDLVSREDTKPINQRFTDYVSPVKLLMIISIITCLIMQNFIKFKTDIMNNGFLKLNFVQKMLVLCFGVTIVPLLAAVHLLKVKNKPINASTLFKPFYALLYSFFSQFIFLIILLITLGFAQSHFSMYAQVLGYSGIILLFIFIFGLFTLINTLQTIEDFSQSRSGLYAVVLIFINLFYNYGILGLLARI